VKTRHAVPLLSVSAAIMIAGLGVASAQDPQGGPPRVDVTGPRIRQPLPLQPAQPLPQAGPPGQGGGAGGPRAPIQPFETGIDYEPVPPGARVTFNLEDADLPDLVRLVSSITGKRFILPGKVRSIKASVYAPTKVTAAEAYQAFLSILELNGMTLVPAGRYLKIVETAGIENQPTSLYGPGDASPGDDRFITRMHRVENVSSEDVATLLSRFKSREGNVTAYAPTNTIIMTDTGTNIRRMLRIVEAIDVPRGGEQVWIEPIHYANATELAARLTEIFPPTQPGGGGGPSPAAPRPQGGAPGQPGSATVGSRGGEMRVTKILADERTNSVIIVATERAYVRILELIRALDTALEGEGRIHVHRLQHGDAEDLAQALTNIVGGGAGGGGGARPGGGGGAAGGASPFEGQVRITAHKPTNSLVITSSLHDYAALRNVIARLDVQRRQVFIEAVIMELSIRRSSKLGLSFHGGIPNTPEDGAISIFGFNAQGSLSPVTPESLSGLALGVRGPQIPESQQLLGINIPAFGVVLNAIANSGDANVLSTPHIIAMDNEEAEISVGENLPLQQNFGFGLPGIGGIAGLPGLGGQQGQAGLGGLGGLAGLGALGGFGGFGGAVPRQDVGTKIKITPHINEADEIRLEIEEEISERGAVEGALQVVSITKRNAKTQVVVRDQQTVVIGGLMRDTVNTSETKVPILGDIPLLGVLFRRTTRETQKTNLLLFLTPYIVRSQADVRAIYERKMRERQEFIDRYFVFGNREYEPPIDYSRTRGLVLEIANELDVRAEERRLLEEAAARPPPEHVYRPALGAVPTGESGGDVVISPDGSTQLVSPQFNPQNEPMGDITAPQQ
jgi:general secretion pathway protein D